MGSAFPKRILTNEDLCKTIDSTDEWIRERTGVLERRISEVGNPEETNSGLAYHASLKALEMAGKTPLDIDAILYGTFSPDTLVPTSACWLQNKLGATRAWGVDLNAACSGFVYALSMANALVVSGQAKTVLVLGSDIVSSFVNWEDRNSCILFGDGSGAAIVERLT
jgi:3-oxoacyl-[acyl-carrier-protein] synthase-3